MAWQTPKTDWSASDGVRDSDFNRIEGNILELYNTGTLHSDTTVYVDGSTGNDSTADGSGSKPFKTITAALNSIPRNTGSSTITLDIGAGTYQENLVIRGFTGALHLYTAGVVNVWSLAISGCNVYQSGTQFNVQRGVTLTNGATYVGNSIMYISSATSGVLAQNGSTFVLFNTLTISNASSVAVEASSCGRVYASILAGSSNSIGARADTGGTISYGSMSLAATTQRITNTGGRIYSGAQTSIPNY